VNNNKELNNKSNRNYLHFIQLFGNIVGHFHYLEQKNIISKRSSMHSKTTKNTKFNKIHVNYLNKNFKLINRFDGVNLIKENSINMEERERVEEQQQQQQQHLSQKMDKSDIKNNYKKYCECVPVCVAASECNIIIKNKKLIYLNNKQNHNICSNIKILYNFLQKIQIFLFINIFGLFFLTNGFIVNAAGKFI